MASSRQFQPFSPIDPMAIVVVSPEAVDFSSLLPLLQLIQARISLRESWIGALIVFLPVEAIVALSDDPSFLIVFFCLCCLEPCGHFLFVL